MRHCQNFNRNYSDKYFRKHCRTNNHLKKAFGVRYIYKKENIVINEIDNTLSDIIGEHKRKFHSFLIVCKINNKKIIGFPKHVSLKDYDKDVLVNIEFNFHSNIEDMSFNYYLSQPKSMLETSLIRKLDKYPEKLKILEYSKAPYYEYLIHKYYGFAIITHDNPLVFCLKDNWLNNTPKEPDNSFKEILRNR